MRICFLETLFLMRTFETKSALNAWVKEQKSEGKTIGFVPTMGALHKGHLALVEQARSENDLVVCSIFVNPIQFNKPEDLEKYPRTLASDIDLLTVTGCDAVFCPNEKEMYPSPDTTVYDFGHLDKVMEGRYRQGHFNGVAIVVKKLFGIVLPDRAYFGQKDYQQLQIIKALVKLEKLDVEIVQSPTIREASGLAMSSRNTRLTPEQRHEAANIYKALQNACKLYNKTSISEIKKQTVSNIEASKHLKVEYFEIVNADTLLPIEQQTGNEKVVACIAVYAGQVRLIDNVLINS